MLTRTFSTVVSPPNPALRAAIRLALAFAAVKLLLHILTNLWQAHTGWGYFRDEFYYIACGRHLTWGYVDHGPLVALQARLAEALFGHSLVGLRLPAALAGAARVFLTGLLCWQLGGRRAAQSLAMLGVLVAPQYLGLDSFLSMNSFESLFWMAVLAALLGLHRRLTLVANAPSLGPWLLTGLAAGLGLLNKPSMTFFLISLAAALLLTRSGRQLLLRREALAGIALLLAITLPYLLWQVHHHWPTLAFLENGRRDGKNLILSPLAFLNQQVQTLNPLAIFLWLPGLIWLLRRPPVRWLGLTFVLFLALMVAMHAKDYYATPIYPILFAAGGIAWQQRTWRPFGRLSRLRSPDHLVAFPLYQATLILTGVLLLPMAIPVLTPATWLSYTARLHLRTRLSNAESSPTGPLPQFYADRFGWQEEANQVSAILASLSPQDRRNLTIFCSNYGEAGALQFLLPSVPNVVSKHNNYWLWGPGTAPPNGPILLITGDSPEHLRDILGEATRLASLDDSPYQMPFERHHSISLVRHPHTSLRTLWPTLKFFY